MATSGVGRRETTTAIAGGIAEWIFAMLPLVVVGIVTIYLGQIELALDSPEWAFGAAILSAQALYRFVGGAIRARSISLERLLFGVAILLVGVVGPANVILVLVVIADIRDRTLSAGLCAAQLVWFGLASVVFVLLATISHIWSAQRTHRANAAP
jgi:hypothetical protein